MRSLIAVLLVGALLCQVADGRVAAGGHDFSVEAGGGGGGGGLHKHRGKGRHGGGSAVGGGDAFSVETGGSGGGFSARRGSGSHKKGGGSAMDGETEGFPFARFPLPNLMKHRKGPHHHEHHKGGKQPAASPAPANKANAELLQKVEKSKLWARQMPKSLRKRIRTQILKAKKDLTKSPRANKALTKRYQKWLTKLDKKTRSRAEELSQLLGVIAVKGKVKGGKAIEAGKADGAGPSPSAPEPKPKKGSEEAHNKAQSTKAEEPPRQSTSYSYTYSKNAYDPYAGAKEGMYEKMHPKEGAKKPSESSSVTPASASNYTKDVRDPKLYGELGIAPGASDAEVRTGYKRTSLKTHPDKGGSKAAFQSMKRAYDVLINAECRRLYDSYGMMGIENQKCE